MHQIEQALLKADPSKRQENTWFRPSICPIGAHAVLGLSTRVDSARNYWIFARLRRGLERQNTFSRNLY